MFMLLERLGKGGGIDESFRESRENNFNILCSSGLRSLFKRNFSIFPGFEPKYLRLPTSFRGIFLSASICLHLLNSGGSQFGG